MQRSLRLPDFDGEFRKGKFIFFRHKWNSDSISEISFSERA